MAYRTFMFILKKIDFYLKKKKKNIERMLKKSMKILKGCCLIKNLKY